MDRTERDELFQVRGSTSGKTKGRCRQCKIVWWWRRGKRRLTDTQCPQCGGRLKPTTYQTKSAIWRELKEGT